MVEPAKTLQGNTAQVTQEEAQRLSAHAATLRQATAQFRLA